MTSSFCVDGALAEPLAGTAPHRRVWALVEHPGPWGRDAPLDAPWPLPGLGADLVARTDEADVRLVLARRPGAGERLGRGDRWDAEGPVPTTVVVAVTAPPQDGTAWTGQVVLDDVRDAVDLDWAALAGSTTRPDGWSDPGPVWAVCTQGTRDACCARLGRPLAATLAATLAQPAGATGNGTGTVWEISHSGGHRFAGVVLAVNEGLVYGRVGIDDVPALVAARSAGRVVRHLLRGATYRSPRQQAAEAALRDHLAEDRLDALTLLEDGGWRHDAADATPSVWDVDVREIAIEPRPASCGKPAEPASALAASPRRR